MVARMIHVLEWLYFELAHYPIEMGELLTGKNQVINRYERKCARYLKDFHYSGSGAPGVSGGSGVSGGFEGFDGRYGKWKEPFVTE